MDLRRLRYFLAVAEDLHFGKAARRLNISQPPLSQQIKRLEDELEAPLFVRDRHGVALTYAGEVLKEEARNLIESAAKTERAVRRAHRGELGSLDIGYAPPTDLKIFPSLVANFRTKYPDIEIVPHSLCNSSLLGALEAGKVQIAVARLPVGRLNVESFTMSRESLCVVVPAGHRLQQKNEVYFQDLANEALIGFPRWRSPLWFDTIANLCLDKGGFLYTPAEEVETIQTQLSLVAVGLGVSIQTSSVEVLERAGTVCLPLADSPQCSELGIAFPKGEKSVVLASFLETARPYAIEAT